MKKIAYLTLPMMLTLLPLGLFLWLSTPAQVVAGACAVPGDHATIQGAVNDIACNTINVGAATYNENVAITRSVTIIGAGPTSTYVDGSGSGSVFTIDPGLTVRLENLTIQNGVSADGGGIYNNDAQLTLSTTQIFSNSAVSNGGGLYNASGWLTVFNSQFLSNTAIFGGGLYTTGTITVSQSLFQGNRAVNQTFSAGGGGGLLNTGIGRIETTVFRSNVGYAGGGAIATSGNLTVSQTTADNNNAISGTGNGGGISNSGDLTIEDSTISNNNAIDGGGLANFGLLTMINSTISGNSANGGGGLQNRGPAIVSYSTFYSNTAIAGGGILALMSLVDLNSSMVALNPSGGDCQFAGGIVASLNYNLDSDNTCNLIQPNDLPATPPLLGPLQINGGWTATHALLPGSPGIDGADPGTCPPADQRGFSRPIGPACDIGPYEVGVTVYLPAARKP